MSRLVIGPFNRVEGDLEVRLDVADGRVSDAHVNATMFRGFEQILLDRDPLDALVYVPRICGICSVSQGIAAAHALADLAGVTPTPNGQIAMNLMLAAENLADHLSHFYLFFMPDFVRPFYAARAWHAEAVSRFTPYQGERHRAALSARQRWLQLMGTLGGKWPHTGSIQPGGSARAIESSERIRLLGFIGEFRQFLEETLFDAPLEEIAQLDSETALAEWRARTEGRGDFRFFLALADDLGLDRLGPGPGLYLSYGAYPQPEGSQAFRAGVWDARRMHLDAVDLDVITEDATHAWLDDTGGARHPFSGLTEPRAEKAGAYTWNKAPRLNGAVLETGAIARQLADGHPLIVDAAARCGGTVYTRVLARLLELARVVPMTERWVRALAPGMPYCATFVLPDEGMGVGLNEAARGSLGHWLAVKDGRIANYQIVAPTSWNFSPRDAGGLPGALEAALIGAPVEPGETTPVAVQHIVRSFDPCMVCTVH